MSITQSPMKPSLKELMVRTIQTWQFMLQTIKVGNDKLNAFFDSGCGDMVCSKRAIDLLSNQKRAKKICKD